MTLVELLVVLAIIAIVSGVVAPNLHGGLRGLRVRQGAMTMAAHIRYAQMLAVDRERPARISLDRAGGRYRLQIARDLVGVEFETAPGVSAETIGLPEGVSFGAVECSGAPDGEKDVLWFDPGGPWSTGEVRLTDGGRTFLVCVRGPLGRIDVLDVPPGDGEPQEPGYADLLASPL